MMLRKWERLPPEMQTDEVRKYYDILKKKQCSLFLKRIFDIVVSSIMIVVLSPVFLILAIVIKIDSKGPVFFRQVRVTQYNKRYRIFKFRSMYQGADRGPQITVNQDARITRVGRVIRDCRLDEISQLFDVWRGTMTFVSVRAESPKYTEQYTNEMMATLLLPAGVTSLASILYKDEAKLLDGVEEADRVYVEQILPAKMYYNLQQIEQFSLGNDLKLMFMTVCAMLGKEYKGTYAEDLKKEEKIGV